MKAASPYRFRRLDGNGVVRCFLIKTEVFFGAGPAAVINPTGTVNVHLTMPSPPRNTAISGLMIKPHTTSPTAADTTTVGMKDRAVCKISCPPPDGDARVKTTSAS